LRIYMNITFSVTGRTLRDIEILFNGETYWKKIPCELSGIMGWLLRVLFL
jgi:hypothetical protein